MQLASFASASVGIRLDFHNQSSVWANQTMIDCLIASWDDILIVSSRDVG